MTSIREERRGHARHVLAEAAFRRKAFWENGEKRV